LQHHKDTEFSICLGTRTRQIAAGAVLRVEKREGGDKLQLPGLPPGEGPVSCR